MKQASDITMNKTEIYWFHISLGPVRHCTIADVISYQEQNYNKHRIQGPVSI